MINKGYIKILRDSQLIVETLLQTQFSFIIFQQQSLFKNDKSLGNISGKGLQILKENMPLEKITLTNLVFVTTAS